MPHGNYLFFCFSVNSSFAYDENGIYGYRRKVDGADTVIPFKNAIKLKQFCQKSQMVINEDYDECLLVFSSAGSYGSFSIINGNNYTKQQAGKSMLTNVSGINGQANTECYIIKIFQKVQLYQHLKIILLQQYGIIAFGCFVR